LRAGGKREPGAEEIQLRKAALGRLKAPFLSRTSSKEEWSELVLVVVDMVALVGGWVSEGIVMARKTALCDILLQRGNSVASQVRVCQQRS
jgi:hypothetical protein